MSTCICEQCTDKLDCISLHKVTMNDDHESIQSEDKLEDPTPNLHDYTNEYENLQNPVWNNINEEELSI